MISILEDYLVFLSENTVTSNGILKERSEKAQEIIKIEKVEKTI